MSLCICKVLSRKSIYGGALGKKRLSKCNFRITKFIFLSYKYNFKSSYKSYQRLNTEYFSVESLGSTGMRLSSNHTVEAGGAVTSLQLVTAKPHAKTYIQQQPLPQVEFNKKKDIAIIQITIKQNSIQL
jgi:hypothetical protein